MRSPRSGLALVAVSAIIVTLIGTMQGTARGSAQSAASVGDTEGGSVCVGSPPAPRIMSLGATGAESPLPPGVSPKATTGGLAYHFNIDGDDLRMVVPPANFHPLAATDRELKVYGFPPRPSSEPALTHWNSMLAAWKGAAPPKPCETDRVNSVTHYATSPFWSGGMNINNTNNVNTFTTADGEWTEPSFVASCPHASAYDIWSGLGGWNSGRLIQAGVDTDTALNAQYVWWEVLAPNHNNPEVKLTGDIVNPGDSVEAYESYTSGGTGSAYFWVFDWTNGLSGSVTKTSWKGVNMSDYYEGTTADFITEAPGGGSAPNNRYYLRKPSNSYTDYFYAEANGQDLKTFPSWSINEVGKSGTVMQNTTFDGVHAWTNFWDSCS